MKWESANLCIGDVKVTDESHGSPKKSAGRRRTPRREALLCAFAEDDDGDGHAKDFEIEPQGPVVDVFEIEADPFAKIAQVAAAAHLPQAGQAGFDAETAAMGEVVEARDFVDGQWARTH